VLHECLLDLGGIDVEATGDDHVLGAVDVAEVTVGAQEADVAGVVPAVGRRLGGRDRILVVAVHDQRAA